MTSARSKWLKAWSVVLAVVRLEEGSQPPLEEGGDRKKRRRRIEPVGTVRLPNYLLKGELLFSSVGLLTLIHVQ